jgi:hypothetical protein
MTLPLLQMGMVLPHPNEFTESPCQFNRSMQHWLEVF